MSRSKMRPEAEHPASVGVAPRGWYPDPEDPSRWGYWNGKRWTERTRPSRGADHPIARGVIGGLMCLYGIPLLWERGGAVGGTVLLFAGLPLFFSAFSGPTQRPLRWFSASLDLLVGGAFAAAGTVAAGGSGAGDGICVLAGACTAAGACVSAASNAGACAGSGWR